MFEIRTREAVDPEREYRVADFNFLPAEPAASSTSAPFHTPEKIYAGERNATLFKLARALKAKGLSESEILAALQSVNASRCVPPLDDPKEIPQARARRRRRRTADFAHPDTMPTLAPGRYHEGSRGHREEDQPARGGRRREGWRTFSWQAAISSAGDRTPSSSARSCDQRVFALVGAVAKAGRDKRGPRCATCSRGRGGVGQCVRQERLVSGEGLIFHVRDPRMDKQPIRERPDCRL